MSALRGLIKFSPRSWNPS